MTSPSASAQQPSAPIAVQGAFDDLGESLRDATFVVVDLETTGGSPKHDGITEIGAVKVRGGAVLGEFQTLVNPGVPIPPSIVMLTGITPEMVATAPRIEQVIGSFLEFARGAILVAHNARFDIGFLRAACAAHDYPWPGAQVVDTVALARRVVGRDETPNNKLATLARYFGAQTSPNHRALADARATVDVFHALLGRLGSLGVTHVADLPTAGTAVPAARSKKRHLAEGLPRAPGVYMFQDDAGEVLYVGTSRNIYTRVRSYFTAAETRRRMTDMVNRATKVVPVECATAIEAQVRELRLIAQHRPAYNRVARNPNRSPYVRLTTEPYPRLSVVRTPQIGDKRAESVIGPFSSAAAAQAAVAALHEAFPLRQCTGRLPLTPKPTASACALRGMGKCGAPCIGEQTAASYAELVANVHHAMAVDPSAIVNAMHARITKVSAQQRYEEAAELRDQLLAALRGIWRSQRHKPLLECPELIAAQRGDDGGWQIILVRHGRLAGTTQIARGVVPGPAIEALRTTGDIDGHETGAGAALPAEVDLILKWLETPGTRLISITGQWASPIAAAGRYGQLLATAQRVSGRAA